MQIKINLANEEIQRFTASREGLLTVSLVREFLSYFNMQFTLSVFDPESSEGVSYTPVGRPELLAELGLAGTEQPILHSLVAQLTKSAGEAAENPSNDPSNDRAADKSKIPPIFQL